MSVRWVSPDRPVRSIDVTVKAMRGGATGKVVCGYSQQLAIRGAPQFVTANRPRQLQGRAVTRLILSPFYGMPTDPLQPESRLDLDGELDVRGTPRGSARSIRPPKLDMGTASVDEVSVERPEAGRSAYLGPFGSAARRFLATSRSSL